MNKEILIKYAEDRLDIKGNKLLVKYYKGGELTFKEALIAKCAECMNNYIDGRADCEMETCPLYPYMPYQKKVERPKRKVSDKQRKAASERMRKMQSKGV